MRRKQKQKYFYVSVSFHVFIVLVLVLGFDFSEPLAVIENTNKNDVISAVVLGDTTKSKILPNKPLPKPIPQEVKEEPKPQPTPVMQKDVIALKAAEKKKLADQKALEEKKKRDQLAKDLLADMEKVNTKQKKQKQKQLQSKFEKRLREQAEKSLREQLLNEEIKLEGIESRQAQGEVNKYKALMMQAISERWVIPIQANKKLYTMLIIRVAPGGMVLDVQITRSSGDAALDSSARAAVFKASPLPVPKDADAFEAFRRFELKMKPENVLASDGGMSG